MKAIAAGGEQSIALLENGTIKRWGGLSYETGTTVIDRILIPTVVPGIADATAIGAGRAHAIALIGDGHIEAWGDNYNSQIGSVSPAIGFRDPVSVSGISSAVSIAAGTQHNLALMADGTVMGWGNNEQRQLGDHGNRVPLPTVMVGLKGIVEIGAGGFRSFAVQDSSQPIARLTLKAAKDSELPVSVRGSGMSGGESSMSYPVGSIVRFTYRQPRRFAQFDGWTGLCQGKGPCVETLTGDTTLSWSASMLPKFAIEATGPGGVVPGAMVRCRLTQRALRHAFRSD